MVLESQPVVHLVGPQFPTKPQSSLLPKRLAAHWGESPYWRPEQDWTRIVSAGSEWAIAPPIVPRLRTCTSPIEAAASAELELLLQYRGFNHPMRSHRTNSNVVALVSDVLQLRDTLDQSL